MTPRMRALYLIEVLRDSAAERLSVSQRELWYFTLRCDLGNAAMCRDEVERAFLDCGRWANERRRVAAR